MALKSNLRTRPVFKISAIDDQEKFKPLPAPSGEYPYRLDIKKVIPDLGDQKFTFHMAGDTGSLRLLELQRHVADAMTKQCLTDDEGDRPSFMLHLGDVVYNFGQASQYYDQFFTPYLHYPNPIFALAGNHDGDVDPMDPGKPASLDAFRAVFCDTESRQIALAGDTLRKSNVQPNVYYTLQTPLADIICLYSNVPKFGTIATEQKNWFINELRTLRSAVNEKALLVCLHHAPYSADINHGSSVHMISFLEQCFTETGVIPDAVFSGHVHNYQRFNKVYGNGKLVPFIVAGAGGYAELHSLANPDDAEFPDDSKLLDDVELQSFYTKDHGFLKLKLVKEDLNLTLKGEYYAVPDNGDPILLHDTFTVNILSAQTS